MAINITAVEGVITLSCYATRTQWPTAPRDTTLDSEFDCGILVGEVPIGISEIIITAHGDWLSIGIAADAGVITLGAVGTWPDGYSFEADAGVITLGVPNATMIIVEGVRQNWIIWSGIGKLDFTIGRDNVAGERPLDWSGWVWAVKKLNDRVIAYGKNGVSILKPADKFYGLSTIHRIGLYSQGAVAGSDSVHFFIDNKAQLWRLDSELTFLGYVEYLSDMTNLVMSYDTENELIYICDGTYGFVYSIRDGSLGTCSPNVTGVGVKDGTLYVASVAAIATPPFEICTDIYDFGTRKFKTVRSIEVSTDLTETMEASVDYRVSKADSFSNIGWHLVNPSGETFLPCYGLEFRFRLRVETYEYFETDSLKINGLIHHYSYTEHMLREVNEKRVASYGS